MQFEPVVLFRPFGVPVYALGVCLALSALVCAFFLKRRGKKQGLRPQTTSVFVLYALIFGFILARLLYCMLRWQQIAYDYDDCFRGFGVILRVWDGGYSLYGALAGALLAAAITARRTRQSFKTLLDWAAPACALMIALGRSVEILGGGGFGAEVMQPQWSFFPVAVYNEWLGSWNYAVFMAEAAAALIILFLLLYLERKPRRAGDLFLLFLLYFGASQIVLERLRRDDVLAFGFVLVAQVISAAFILFAAAIVLSRSLRAGAKKGSAVLTGICTLAAAVWSGVTEFLFDKNLFGVLVIGNSTLHLLRAAILLALSVLLTVRLLHPAGRSAPKPAPPSAA